MPSQIQLREELSGRSTSCRARSDRAPATNRLACLGTTTLAVILRRTKYGWLWYVQKLGSQRFQGGPQLPPSRRAGLRRVDRRLQRKGQF